MSKRGAGEREGFNATQNGLRKARVEVRRVDAIQVLMAAARARTGQPALSPQQQQHVQPAVGTTASAGGAPPAPPPPQVQQQPQPAAVTPLAAAPCTHCGTVLLVSSAGCSLRQCSSCLDVFCSLCSVLDYEEREDRVFCLTCLDDQTAASRRGRPATPCAAGGGNGSAAGGGGPGGVGSMSNSMALPTTGRWGQLDQLGMLGGRSPFPCSANRTPQHGTSGGAGGGGGRTPGSAAVYGSRSHRGFSALVAYGGPGS